MRIGADPWKRIEFYVRHGLVPHLPTPYQLKQASKYQYSGSAVPERIKYYLKHPIEIFPTKKKIASLRQPNKDVAAGDGVLHHDTAQTKKIIQESHLVGGNHSKKDQAKVQSKTGTMERVLRDVFLFSPARLSAHLLYNPWFVVPGTGLEVPLKYMVAHLAHGPHPFPLWDLQIIHADEGGLDLLERELDIREKGSDFKSQVYRALAQREGYYDHLRGLIPKIKQFEYPSVPDGFNPILENLVRFLEYALTLKDDPIQGKHNLKKVESSN